MLYRLQFSCWTLAQAQDLAAAFIPHPQFDTGDIEDWAEDEAILTVPKVYMWLDLHSLEDVATAKAIATLRSPMRVFFGTNEAPGRAILFSVTSLEGLSVLALVGGLATDTPIEEGWLFDPNYGQEDRSGLC